MIHDRQMSREDPQFKLRMPASLRLQAEHAARTAGRSLNAEIVARLESTFLSESTSEELIPASKAKELSAIARICIPDEIRRRTLKAINKAVSLGHSAATVDLTDLQLDGNITDEEIERLTGSFSRELSEAGYDIEWDGAASIWIRFE